MRTVLCDKPEIEYLDGRPFPKVSPKSRHSFVQLDFARILQDCAGDRGSVGAEWRFNLTPVVGTKTELVPDVAFVARERLAPLAGDDLEMPLFAPDVAVEVRSPSDREDLVRSKIDKYFAAGSLLVLDVDPQERSVVAHTVAGTREFTGATRFEHPVVPWLRFDLRTLFARLDTLRR